MANTYWRLSMRDVAAHTISVYEKSQWNRACEVLKEVARSQGLHVSEGLENCFRVWSPDPNGRRTMIEVPLELDAERFYVEGDRGDPHTFPFCHHIEAVVAFLFPMKFEVDWCTLDDFPLNHSVGDDEGTDPLFASLGDFARRIWEIKYSVPSLAELSYQHALRVDRDVANQIMSGILA